MNKPEHIYLSEGDAIDSFAPEQAGEPRRAAQESSQEQLDAFQPEPFAGRPEPFANRPEPFANRPEPFANRSEPFANRSEPFANRPEPFANRPEPFANRPEVFASSPRASVHYQSRHRIHPAALAAVAGITAVFAVVLAQRSNAPAAVPFAPVA